MSSKLYYHFTSDKLRDGTKIPEIGEWLIYPEKPIICVQGLHASEHPFQALKYAPGNLLHLVELSNIETIQEDKVVAKGRRIIATIDSTELLQKSARKFALDVIDLWNPPNIVKEYLITGDESKVTEATDAAEAAARAAARAATWATEATDAAEAAEAAARAATWAARAAARAARAATWATDAAEAAEAAARAATWAARAAARAARAAARATRAATWVTDAAEATTRATARAAEAATWAATWATEATTWTSKQRESFLSEVKEEFRKCGYFGI